jgi:hypothetical protein
VEAGWCSLGFDRLFLLADALHAELSALLRLAEPDDSAAERNR